MNQLVSKQKCNGHNRMALGMGVIKGVEEGNKLKGQGHRETIIMHARKKRQLVIDKSENSKFSIDAKRGAFRKASKAAGQLDSKMRGAFGVILRRDDDAGRKTEEAHDGEDSNA